jgi:hypothetical protein
MKVAIEKIRLDGGTQFRKVLHQDKIYEYKEAMESGAEFPKIKAKFDGLNHWLYSGFHRYHAMKLLQFREIEIISESGTQHDAVIAALAENSTHGIPLTNEEKRMKVVAAIALDEFAKASNYEIAKICCVSQPFVASIRDKNVAEQQKKSREKSAIKKANTNPISMTKSDNLPKSDNTPSDEEMMALELAEEKDREIMNTLLDSDDKLKDAYEEIKRLNLLNARYEVRIEGLMNERNAAAKMVTKLQKALDKLQGK